MANNQVLSPAEILKRPYHRVVVSDESGLFGAEISEFPGCLAVGDTAAEALANLEDVAEGWLLGVIELKQPIPEPFEESDYSGKLVLRLPKTLHETAAIAAARDGVSLNMYITAALAGHVGAAQAKAIQPRVAHIYNYTTITAPNSQIVALTNYSGAPPYTISEFANPTLGLVAYSAVNDSKWGRKNG